MVHRHLACSVATAPRQEAEVTGVLRPLSWGRCSKLRGPRAQITLYSVAALLTGLRKRVLLKKYLLGPVLGTVQWVRQAGGWIQPFLFHVLTRTMFHQHALPPTDS